MTPYDKANNAGKPSTVFFFNAITDADTTPHLAYPLHYYVPSSDLQPHEDRTIPVPIFMWMRVPISPTNQAVAYRIHVDDDPLFGSPNWTFDTQNLSAAPTTSFPFAPVAGTDYYWRVRPLSSLGGSEVGQWSQVWQTRIDLSQGLPPTTTVSLPLLRPAHGSEWVETVPLFEWWPRQGADSYEVQISTDSTFATLDDYATVPYPAYAPRMRLGFATYYWRARGRSGGAPLGDWSETRRFQIAAQSHWRLNRTIGSLVTDNLLIASDPSGDAGSDYDLTTLYAGQDLHYWHFGFNVSGSADATFGLYIDLDHVDNSGASTDPKGYSVTTTSGQRPEYAIYIPRSSGTFTETTVSIYRWTGSSWATPITLASVCASPPCLESSAGYVGIKAPNTAIGMEERTGSATVILFSAQPSGGSAQDTVPSNPSSTTFSRFTSVSERLVLAVPPNRNATNDPAVFHAVPPFFWSYPTGDVFALAWYGYQFQAALDVQFTTVPEDYQVTSDAPAIVPSGYSDDRDLIGDNTYYWRARPVYYGDPIIRGAWSEPWRFEREGFAPENLQVSTTFATPTFSWDMVEGADSYDLQVDNDQNFGSPNINVTTSQNSYTPSGTLANGAYYWRVRVRRYGGVLNDWIVTSPFTLTLPQPANLSHDPPGVAPRAPTLSWTPLITPSVGTPILAAWKYRVQVSKDATFSSIFDTADTEQSSWSPTKGYDDGTYYWRVAMMDGEGRLGNYSPYATFVKQYPTTTLLSPTNGSTVPTGPTFVWTPVNGAAKYKLEVSIYPNFSQIYKSVETNNTRYTPTDQYTIGRTYYWRVAMIDKDGKIGPFNSATVILDPRPYKNYLPLIRR